MEHTCGYCIQNSFKFVITFCWTIISVIPLVITICLAFIASFFISGFVNAL